MSHCLWLIFNHVIILKVFFHDFLRDCCSFLFSFKYNKFGTFFPVQPRIWMNLIKDCNSVNIFLTFFKWQVKIFWNVLIISSFVLSFLFIKWCINFLWEYKHFFSDFILMKNFEHSVYDMQNTTTYVVFKIVVVLLNS